MNAKINIVRKFSEEYGNIYKELGYKESIWTKYKSGERKIPEYVIKHICHYKALQKLISED